MGKCLEFVDGPKVVLSKGATSAAIAIPQLPRHHNWTTHVWSFPLQVAITVGMAAARFEWLPLGEFDELVKTPKAMGLQRFEPGEFQSSERRFSTPQRSVQSARLRMSLPGIRGSAKAVLASFNSE
jgi:hypothetical protein